jgi:hypothetical protein
MSIFNVSRALGIVAAVTVVMGLRLTSAQEELKSLPTASTSADENAAVVSEKTDGEPHAVVADEHRVPVELAREQAKLLHEVTLATLHTMHDRYFHADRAVVPARAMEDVFEQLQQDRQIMARWISASMSPMSIQHEPETEFEKRAARLLAKGESSVEVIEGGYYRRAGSVPMTGGCVSCHAGFFTKTNASSKFSGLVISIPVAGSDSTPATPETP